MFFSRVVCVVLIVNDAMIILVKNVEKCIDKSVNFLLVVLMVEFGVFLMKNVEKKCV